MGRYKNREVLKYPEESLNKALKEIRENRLGIREASRTYGVPRGTIQDRLHGRVKEGPRKMGPSTVLTKDEEDELEKWLIQLAKCGFPQKKNDLLTTVEKIIKSEKRKTPFKEDRPGEKWYLGFLRRHPNLSLREAEGLTKARSIITRELIEKWFRDLKEYLEVNGAIDILKDPTRIFNGDETSFAMCPKSGKVLAPKGYKNIYEIKKGSEKETITVLLVFSADGKTVSPMVVFPFIRPNKAVINSVPAEWFLGRSESGWMKSDTFYEYIANGMDKWLNDNNITRPILLLVDGHKSHLSMDLSKFCYDHDIILYALPPNTTHIMQPADVSVFKPLKTNWKKTLRQWQAEPQNVNSVLTKCTFCPLLKNILDDESLPRTIQNGFRKCGLYPFNPEAVGYTKCIQNLLETQQPQQGTNNILTEDQLDTATVVLNSLKEQFSERGIHNINEIVTELQQIKQNFYPGIGAKTETFNVRPDGFLQMDVNDIPITFDFEPNDQLQLNEQTSEEPFTEELTISTIETKINENEEEKEWVDGMETKAIIEFEQITIKLNGTTDTDNLINEDEPKDTRRIIPKNETDIEHTQKEVISINETKAKNRTNEILTDTPKTSVVKEKMEIQKTEMKNTKETNIDIKSRDTRDLKTEMETRVTVLQDIVIQNAQGGIGPFRSHMFYPTPLVSTHKRQPKYPLPAAISAVEYRKVLQQKMETKENAEKEKLKRKEERDKKKDISSKKRQKKQSTEVSNRSESDSDDENMTKRRRCSRKRKKNMEITDIPLSSKIKERCANCDLILDSDTEDNELKNIGCDSCPKWYHLKCTEFQGCNFSDVENSFFICNFCVKT